VGLGSLKRLEQALLREYDLTHFLGMPIIEIDATVKEVALPSEFTNLNEVDAKVAKLGAVLQTSKVDALESRVMVATFFRCALGSLCEGKYGYRCFLEA